MSDTLAKIQAWLDLGLDEWTKKVVRRTFDPNQGSRYWLKKATELDFEPRDITKYSELEAFGPFRLDDLRTLDPADLVPMAEPRPLTGCVYDSGGTTGDPCRVFYTEKMLKQRAAWRQWSFETEGFLRGRAWIQGTPTGPHLIGAAGVVELAKYYDSRVYAVDVDSRWVKRLVKEGRLPEVEAYTAHVIGQITHIMNSQKIDYLNTTPALFNALVRLAPEHAASLRGVRMSGTQITQAMYRSFKNALNGGILGRTYGNTFGTSAGLPSPDDGKTLPYVPNYPQVTMAVVDSGDWTKAVGYGKSGRVRLTVMHEDLFLPNILERDQALRYDTGGGWPCDGVANVRPLQISRSAPEGIY